MEGSWQEQKRININIKPSFLTSIIISLCAGNWCTSSEFFIQEFIIYLNLCFNFECAKVLICTHILLFIMYMFVVYYRLKDLNLNFFKIFIWIKDLISYLQLQICCFYNWYRCQTMYMGLGFNQTLPIKDGCQSLIMFFQLIQLTFYLVY